MSSVSKIERVLKNIHNSGFKLALSATGCCSSLLSWFTLFPGSSQYTVETYMPYSYKSLEQFLKFKPVSAVSAEVTEAMSNVSFLRAQNIYIKENNYIVPLDQTLNGFRGIGISGALQTTRNLKGGNRAYMSIMGEDFTSTTYVEINEDLPRIEQDSILSEFFLLIIGRDCNAISQEEIRQFLSENESSLKVTSEVTNKHEDVIDLLLSNKCTNIFLDGSGRKFLDIQLDGFVVIAGSFNPLHDAHIELGKVTAKTFGVSLHKIVYELSIRNAEKGVIDKETIYRRLAQFKAEGLNVMLSTKALFCQKNDYSTRGFFAVGADTYKRIVDIRFYDNNYDKMLFSIGQFTKNENKLIVFPRLNSQNGKVETLHDFQIPAVLLTQVDEVKDYRHDVSSTELRAKGVKIQT